MSGAIITNAVSFYNASSFLYLWKLQKLFYFVTGKNIDWKNRAITHNSPAGIICLYWNNLSYGT